MVVPASVIVDALPHLSTPIRVANFSKKRTELPKGMLIVVGLDLLEVIFYLDQAAVFPSKRERRRIILLQTNSQKYSTKKESREDPVDRQNELETVYDSVLDTDWRENIKTVQSTSKTVW